MEAKDLRIGNLIQDCFGKVYVINGVTKKDNCVTDFSDTVLVNNDVGVFKLRTDGIEPIRLTDEWLMNFGFTGGGKNAIKLIKINDFYYECLVNRSLGVDIKYVHQLQNLYYALTGFDLSLS